MTGKSKDAGASGGAAWGGARPGAGRKRKQESATSQMVTADPPAVDVSKLDMLQFLQAVARGEVRATPLQVRAAIAAVQYTHTRRSDGGKKDEIAEQAKKAATGGRFSASAPPRLVTTGGREL